MCFLFWLLSFNIFVKVVFPYITLLLTLLHFPYITYITKLLQNIPVKLQLESKPSWTHFWSTDDIWFWMKQISSAELEGKHQVSNNKTGEQRIPSLLKKTKQHMCHTNSPQFSSVAQSCPTLCDPMNRSPRPLLLLVLPFFSWGSLYPRLPCGTS